MKRDKNGIFGIKEHREIVPQFEQALMECVMMEQQTNACLFSFLPICCRTSSINHYISHGIMVFCFVLRQGLVLPRVVSNSLCI